MEAKEGLSVLTDGLRKGWKRYRAVCAVMLAGLFLLAVSGGGREKPAAEITEPPAAFDLTETEARLSRILSRIHGAGEVTVMLTVRDGPRQVLAQDVQGGESPAGARSQTVVLSRGGGTQETVTVQELSPGFQGALLVCRGGDDPQVRLALTRAVSALTGLGTDRISICREK